MLKKCCPTCCDEKEVTEFFADKRRLDGLQAQCKVCQRRAARRRYAKDPQKREIAQTRAKLWYENNKERSAEAKKKHYTNNKDVCIQRSRDWYKTNKAKAILRHKLYVQNNKEKYRLKEYFSLVIAPKIRKRDNNTCYNCKCFTNLQVHHIIPIKYDKSKMYDEINMITLCKQCHFDVAHSGDYKQYNLIFAAIVQEHIKTKYRDTNVI